MKKAEVPIMLGILIYALIALWQGAEKTDLVFQVAGFILILAVIAIVLRTKNEPKLKNLEMAAIWSCIALFAMYVVLIITGVL